MPRFLGWWWSWCWHCRCICRCRCRCIYRCSTSSRSRSSIADCVEYRLLSWTAGSNLSWKRNVGGSCSRNESTTTWWVVWDVVLKRNMLRYVRKLIAHDVSKASILVLRAISTRWCSRCRWTMNTSIDWATRWRSSTGTAATSCVITGSTTASSAACSRGRTSHWCFISLSLSFSGRSRVREKTGYRRRDTNQAD